MRFPATLLAAAVLIGASLAGCNSAYAAERLTTDPSADCGQFFAAGVAPKAAAADTMVCYDGYALGHSRITRNPVWSAEHETPASAKAALAAKRVGDFHPDPLIPADDQSKSADFHCAPYDQGHATPVGDFGPTPLKVDTFSMANMMVQWFSNNEGLHAGIEHALLLAAAAGHELYVVTGPGFSPNPALLNGRDQIPTTIYKAVFDATTGAAAVYVEVNDGSSKFTMMSDAEATDLLGFDPLPGIPSAAKAVAGALPKPSKGTPVEKTRSCAAH